MGASGLCSFLLVGVGTGVFFYGFRLAVSSFSDLYFCI